MDRLTEAQIEKWRAICLSHWVGDETGRWLSHEESARQANALCDLALQSLSQEAVRDEALEEAAEAVNHLALYGPPEYSLAFCQAVEAIRALKREPNAAAQAPLPARLGSDAKVDSRQVESATSACAKPAPAAPDVASMVKELTAQRIADGANETGLLGRAAALLAKLGQGWIPVAWIEHHKGGDNLTWERIDHPYAQATPLYKAPGASDA